MIGDVKLGQNSSVWYGSVLRGDVSLIEIGDDSIIQDLVTLKRASGEGPVRIGRGVTIGPNCYIGGAVVEDYAYIGMGSFIGDGCVVESYAVLAAGANLHPGSRVPSGQIWAGSPAKYLRDVSAEERDSIREYHDEMKSLAAIHAEETEKSFEQIFHDDFMKERSFTMSWSETLGEKLDSLGYSDHPIDQPDIERVRGWEYSSLYERHITEMYSPKSWKPFKEDAAVFPEDWKIYGEDMESYDRAKKIFDQPPRNMDEDPSPAVRKDESPWARRF